MEDKLKRERDGRDREKFEREFYGIYLKSLAEPQGLDHYRLWDFIRGYMKCGWSDDDIGKRLDEFKRDLKWDRQIYGDRDRAIGRICISTSESSRPETRVSYDALIDNFYSKSYNDAKVNAKLWEMVHENEKNFYRRYRLSKSDIAERNRLYDEEGTRHAQYIMNIENRERQEREEKEERERIRRERERKWDFLISNSSHPRDYL
ncbi:unnamed protein product [Phytomonas sp. Hart1]|nr:unnamed protein product [Phytomonas sp. Hart1]|eukprot:CCW72206.1 unnamed protein product [Phytomonas sp. isolate Hart1]